MMSRLRRVRPRLFACAALFLLSLSAIGAGSGSAAIQGSEGATPVAAGSTFDPLEVPWLDIREQELRDGDDNGRPDGIRIFGYWFTTEGDTLNVYKDSEDFPAEADYRQVLDFTASTWVIDLKSDGRAELIVRFVTDGGRVSALVWDDQNEDEQVAYTVNGRRVSVTESQFPSLQMSAETSWFNPDGSINYDLRGELNGCGFCDKMPTEAGYPPVVERRFLYDDQPDFLFSVSDKEHDGIPESYYWLMVTNVSERSYGLPRMSVLANEGQSRPANPSGYLFWPYLSLDPINRADRYFDRAPFLPVQWGDSKIDTLAVRGYPIEAGFHINSYARANPDDSPISANFEIPMAYYDLAEDQDNSPELHVRMGYYRPNDPIFNRGLVPLAINTIRYSWNQSNAPGSQFDFKVDVSGRHPITTSYAFGDLDVAMVPYAEFPSWVTAQSWEVTTFVAVMGTQGYASTEGIYDWGTGNSLDYIGGLPDDPPTWTSIKTGLRGDYRVEPGAVELYLDPLDGLLHLNGLQGGVWHVSRTKEVRYLPGVDGRVGGWQVWDNGVLTSELYRVPGGLVLSTADGTWFRPLDEPADVFRAAPPADHERWLRFSDALATVDPEMPRDDLAALFGPIDASVVRIADGMALASTLAAPALDLTVPVTDAETAESLSSLTGTEVVPGLLEISVGPSGWTATRAAAQTPTVALAFNIPSATHSGLVTVDVSNPGSLALENASVTLEVVDESGEVIDSLGSRDVSVAPGGSDRLEFTWQLATQGQHLVRARIERTIPDPRTRSDIVLAEQLAVADVPIREPLANADAGQLGWAGALSGRLLMLAGLLLVTGITAVVALRPYRAER